MLIKLKRFNTNIPFPGYKSEKAAAFDIYTRQDLEIAPHSVGMMPLNFAIELPPSHWLLLSARSSLHKKGVMLANGIGVGDEDFCGDSDEYQAALLNFTDQIVTLSQGERILQGIVLMREKVELIEVTTLRNKDRGGFGSTGQR